MTSLAGTGKLARFILRRDRWRLLIWIAAVVVSTVGLAATSRDLYPTPESLQARAQIMDSPIGRAFGGPGIGLDNYTFGALMANEYVSFLALTLGLMSIFLVIRNTRVEEQTGRSELVQSAAVGRHASAAAALLVVIGAQILIGVLIALQLPGTGLDLSVEGSWLFSAAIVSTGVAFAAIALVAAEVTSHSRTAVAVGVAVMVLSFTITAIANIAESLSIAMFSPISWAVETRSFVENLWWPLLVSLGFFVLMTSLAFALNTRRDFGEGLVAARRGPAEADPALGTPLGLAWRLQKGLVFGWGIGIFLLAYTYGTVLGEIEEFASQNPFIEEALSAVGGGTLSESWASFLALLMTGLIAGFAVQSTLRLRSEEVGVRADPVLANPTDRWSWMGSHLVLAALGSVVMAILVGVGFGLSAGPATGDWSWLPTMTGAALSHVPSMFVVAGVAVALFGLLPRLTYLAWVMIAIVWVGLFGVIVGLPEWVANLSPFGYGAMVPAADVDWAPLLILSAIAIALVVAGFVGFRRRDIETAGA